MNMRALSVPVLVMPLLAAFSTAAAHAAAPPPAWQAVENGDAAHGVRLLDGADGSRTFTAQAGAPCAANKPDAQTPSEYLYFDIEPGADFAAGTPVYVLFEYYDPSPGGRLVIEYDSTTGDTIRAKYQPCEEQWGGRLSGRKAWRTGVCKLEKPLLHGRQNLGADFRMSGAAMFIRAVRILNEPPADLEKLDEVTAADLKPRVKLGRKKELIIGGFDPAGFDSAKSQLNALVGAIPAMKTLGVTSHEGYVRWNLCEPEQGRYDWSVYDGFVAAYKKYGLKWVPFLIVGSPYSLPDWYYKKPGSQGYVCLEHNQQSDVESLWNPVLRGHVARFIQAFCEHYRDTGVIESILLGVTGNYGEAIYPATGNDWTADVHGPYHAHSGYWAGDPFAVTDFRAWLARKYTGVDALNKAWDSTFTGFDAVRPFVRTNAPNDRAWLDFCDWYIGSMSEWSRFWMHETRRHFKGGIYLCTGGHAPAEHGADFGEQCKLAAEINGGVRITNEASNYAANFSLTRWVASAGRQYGAYYSFEPAGPVDTNGVVGRIYNATSSGARGLHYYYPNLFAFDAACQNFIHEGGHFRKFTPKTEIAVYYPETAVKLNKNSAEFLGMLQPLRDRFDFDYCSDGQILDGGLRGIKALLLLWGNTAEAPVWDAIHDWQRNGGLVLYADGMGRLRTVEGSEQPHDRIVGPNADTGKGRVATFSGKGNTEECRAFLAKTLAAASELSRGTRRLLTLDGREDKVYGSVSTWGRILWLNFTGAEQERGGLTLPPFSIRRSGI